MKVLKRILIIVSITVAAIFLILLVTPVLFKGKILEIAKKELNNMLTAKVDFSDVKLSFIRNFPDAYIALEDLTVTGTGEFEDETLVSFKSLSVTVNIMSVIRMNNIKVRSVLLDKVEVSARILENSKANWDIVKSGDNAAASSAKVAPEKVDKGKDTAASTFKVALKKFEIRDANISFRDDLNKMTATANDLNFLLRGDMSLDNADLDMKLDIADVNFWMNGIRMLKNARVGLVSEVAADLKNMGFTLKENQFNLNEIILKFAGSIQIPGDINVDMTFATEKTDFKSVLSLIPAIYMKDFESITTTGSFTLSGDVKGTYSNEQMPSAGVNLTVDNAMFKYPVLPKSVNNINIAVKAFYDGVVFDKTTLDVDKFHFEMAGNPFDTEVHVKTPESDMQIAAKFAGRIDFNSLADIVPLDDIILKGLLECDLALAGRMSTLENERYEDFDAGGMLKLSGVNFESPDFPQAVKISTTQLNFTPKKVDLAAFDAVIGNTDIALNGTLENFISFVLKGGTVQGKLNLKSNKIDLNEFMTGEKAEETAEVPADTSPLTIIEVPKNIDFAMNVNIGNILFDKLSITNTVGMLLVKDGKLQMQNLAMNLLEGSMALSGEYNTQDIKVPFINLGMDIKQFDITSALSSFSLLEKILPNPQNYAGKVSANLTLNSILDEHLGPVLNTVASKGTVQTHNVEIRNSELFGAFANLLKNEAWRTPVLNNLNIKYEIKDGQLMVEPIQMNISRAKLELSGSQGLDMTLNYKVNTSVPVSTIGSGATDLLSKIPGGSNIKELTVTGLMGGMASSPSVSLSAADMTGNVVTSVTEGVKGQAREEIDKQAAAIMADAEKQAENIRNTAKQTADKLRNEANAAADKLEKDANSPIEKIAAKVAADKLRNEGEANAVKVEQEAERQVTAIMDTARKKADSTKSN
ncbi:MAG: AsmA family protein [Treponema sp.]|jgi:hypothetical protein|nr:AsmA family protein [Treponema sp.]